MREKEACAMIDQCEVGILLVLYSRRIHHDILNRSLLRPLMGPRGNPGMFPHRFIYWFDGNELNI